MPYRTARAYNRQPHHHGGDGRRVGSDLVTVLLQNGRKSEGAHTRTSGPARNGFLRTAFKPFPATRLLDSALVSETAVDSLYADYSRLVELTGRFPFQRKGNPEEDLNAIARHLVDDYGEYSMWQAKLEASDGDWALILKHACTDDFTFYYLDLATILRYSDELNNIARRLLVTFFNNNEVPELTESWFWCMMEDMEEDADDPEDDEECEPNLYSLMRDYDIGTDFSVLQEIKDHPFVADELLSYQPKDAKEEAFVSYLRNNLSVFLDDDAIFNHADDLGDPPYALFAYSLGHFDEFVEEWSQSLSNDCCDYSHICEEMLVTKDTASLDDVTNSIVKRKIDIFSELYSSYDN